MRFSYWSSNVCSSDLIEHVDSACAAEQLGDLQALEDLEERNMRWNGARVRPLVGWRQPVIIVRSREEYWELPENVVRYSRGAQANGFKGGRVRFVDRALV